MQLGRILGLFLLIGLWVPSSVNAQIYVLEVIRLGVKRVIRAVDLKLQRLQNKTIWLQNAQRKLENELSKLQLGEIYRWTEKHRAQYTRYYQGLLQVNRWIKEFTQLSEISERQIRLFTDYQKVWKLLRDSGQFNTQELISLDAHYTSMLQASIEDMESIFTVLQSYRYSISDAGRLRLLNGLMEQLEERAFDLRAFNERNILLLLDRQQQTKQLEDVKELYELTSNKEKR